MRKSRFFICFALTFAGIMALNTFALSHDYPYSSIRFNFGVWDTADNDLGITVHHTDLSVNERLTEVEVSGMSASFAFSRMVGDRFAWELSMGGFSDSESTILRERSVVRYRGDYYETVYSDSSTVSVAYMMVGLIYYPFYELDRVEFHVLGDLDTFIRPYLAAGIGPYFGWDVRWDEDDITDANFSSAMGAYPGVGIDVLLSRHFVFNFDLRYHFVEFPEPLKDATDYSGLNVVAGFKVMF